MDMYGRRWGKLYLTDISKAISPLTFLLQIQTHAQNMLGRKGRTLKDVVEVLKVSRDNMDEDISAASQVDDASPPQKEILGGLITYLDGC